MPGEGHKHDVVYNRDISLIEGTNTMGTKNYFYLILRKDRDFVLKGDDILRLRGMQLNFHIFLKVVVVVSHDHLVILQ